MNEYTITRVEGQPDWSQIPTLGVDNHLWLGDSGIRMTAQFCYDPEGIHVHLRAKEKDIRAEYDAPLSMVCEDSCMEFFFRPDENDPRYFNFEVNPNGRMYIGVGYDRYQTTRLCPNDEDQLLQKDVHRTEDGWEIFYTIPMYFMRVLFPNLELKPGNVIYANVFKCGELCVRSHFMSWNFVASVTPDFHRSQDFGKMILG